MAKELVTLGGMTEFFREDLKCIGKGELKFKADFVLELRIIDHTIHAKVRASMKDKSYCVLLKVDGDGGILEGTCECPRGNWLCSHMAASAIYANRIGLSKTDLPNSWIARPKKAAKLDSKSCAEFFPEPKQDFNPIARAVNCADREFMYLSLAETGLQVPMQWIVGPEPPAAMSDPRAPYLMDDLLQDFVESKDTFIAKCQVTEDQILWLAEQTTAQRQSVLWAQYRRLRLTGSNFGDVIRACYRNINQNRPFPPSLFKNLKGEYSFGSKDSILWGQMHEDVAVSQYQDITGNKVKPAGLYLFPCGFLGCSPDGIIEKLSEGVSSLGSNSVLDVKCPRKYRNAHID